MPRLLAEDPPILPRLHRINALEARIVAREVPHYFSEGIRLPAGATVVDVGANIGAFSASVFDRLAGDVRIFAFEPGPPIFAVLERNARDLFAGRLTALPYGLSAQEHDGVFTFYPAYTTLSSTAGDTGAGDAAERERFVRRLIKVARSGEAGRLARWIPRPVLAYGASALVRAARRRMRESRTHQVRLRPLSAVIEEHAIETIDLLKVDVERAELDVLAGIHDRHWPRIHQAVIEVEPWDIRHHRVRALLSEHGFHVRTRQSPIEKAMNIGLVYAVRNNGVQPAG